MVDLSDPQFLAFQEALAGRYSIQAEIGRGGMGIVYLAHDVQLDRPVAIKLLPEHFAAMTDRRARFLQEARTAAKLSHPNIVPIFSVEEIGRFVYFVMAYVAGETLGERLRNQGPVPPSQAANILKEVSWALAYAHEQGVIHRDIKPENILLEESTGRALVADFGIAGVMEGTDPTGVGEVLGTIQFMSPEQAQGTGVDPRSDIYSLGVVGYFILSGQLPHTGNSIQEILTSQNENPPAPLKQLTQGVPSRLARTVERCLSVDAEGRFDNAAALGEAVAEIMMERREIPVPVRVFLNDPIDLGGDGLIYFAFGGAINLAGLSVAFDYPEFWPFYGIFTAFFLGTPWVLESKVVRRFIESGYNRDDVVRALKTEASRRREEMTYRYGDPSIKKEKLAFSTARVLGATGAILLGADLLSTLPFSILTWHAPLTLLTFLGSGASALRGLAFRNRRVDPKAEARLSLWKSFFGKGLFKLMKIGVKKRPVSIHATHRPTEIQIGFAADAIFEELPKQTRKELGDVPSVIRRLEADAQRLRGIMEQFDEALGSARLIGKAPEDLSSGRELAGTRLAEVVASLETLRLGLLRLKTGGSVENFTTHLLAAQSIGGRIKLLMEGLSEVEGLLTPT